MDWSTVFMDWITLFMYLNTLLMDWSTIFMYWSTLLMEWNTLFMGWSTLFVLVCAVWYLSWSSKLFVWKCKIMLIIFWKTVARNTNDMLKHVPVSSRTSHLSTSPYFDDGAICNHCICNSGHSSAYFRKSNRDCRTSDIRSIFVLNTTTRI